MNQKKTAQKVTPKATDITNTKKTSSEQPLVIPKRSIIGREEAKINLPEEPEEPIVSPISRKTIIPVENTSNQPVSPPQKGAAGETESDAVAKAPPQKDTTTNSDAAGSTDSAEIKTDEQETSDQPTSDNQEEVKKTAEAVKRERELQEYIKNRKYFVPVNTAAEKRSIKVSFGLIFLILILGFVLIDLLLDTGAILLVQKIPHTHFFNITTNY